MIIACKVLNLQVFSMMLYLSSVAARHNIQYMYIFKKTQQANVHNLNKTKQKYTDVHHSIEQDCSVHCFFKAQCIKNTVIITTAFGVKERHTTVNSGLS